MDIQTAEENRLIRFYEWAQNIVEKEVSNSYPILHSMGLSEYEDRSKLLRFDIEEKPQEDVLSRWKNNLTIFHSEAASLLEQDVTNRLDFFPSRFAPFDRNSSSLFSEFLAIELYALKTIENFSWQIKKESEFQKTTSSFRLSENVYMCEDRFEDWSIHPIIRVHTFIDHEMDRMEGECAAFKCNISFEFEVKRDDSANRAPIGPTRLRDGVSVAQFLGLNSVPWIFQTEDEVREYNPRFLKVVDYFMKGIKLRLKGLGISD